MILANQFGRPTYYYFPRQVFRSHMCIVYISFSEYKIAHALNFGSCYAQISTSRCVAFGGVTSCTLVCFPLLLSPGCFVGGPSTFLSRAWVYVSRIVGVIVCGCICVSTCVFLFYTYYGGPTTFSSLPYLLLHTYTLHIQSLCVQPARDPRRELCSPT